MKKIRLFFAAAAAMVGLSMNAQSWTAPEVPGAEVGAGSFVLYNVGSGQYLTAGNAWGTQASITTTGISGATNVTLVANGSDYFIRTGVGNANYGLENLAASGDVYMDQSRNKQSTWTFTEVGSDNSPIYTLTSADNHGGGSGAILTANSSNTVVSDNGEASSAYAQWKLIPEASVEKYVALVSLYDILVVAYAEGVDTKSASAVYTNSSSTTADILAAVDALDDARLANASTEHPYDATNRYITNPTPVNNLDGWTGTGIGGHDNGVAEYWNAGGASFSQTVNLPEGLYELKLVALTRTGMVATLAVNDYTTNIVTVGNDVVNNRGAAATWFNGGNGVNTIKFQLEGSTDVKISLTADNTTGDHWLVWRNFTLTYYGIPSDPLAFYREQLADAVDAAKAVEGVPEVAYNALLTFANGKNKTYSTIEDYKAATSAIHARIADVKAIPAIVSKYDVVKKAALALQEQEVYTGSATVNTTNADAAIAAATTTAEANAAIALLRKAAATFIGAVKVNEGQYFDITQVFLNNADFSDGNIEGWETNYVSGVQAVNIGYQGASYTNEEVTISKFIEAWLPSGNLGDGYLRQTVSNLPAGKYVLEADAIAVNQSSGATVTGAYLFINADATDFAAALNTANKKPEHFTTDFLFSGKGDVQFGLKTVGATANWMCADNFTVKFYGEAALTDYQAILNAAVETTVAGLAELKGKVPAVMADVAEEMGAYKNAEYDTADEYLAAIELVNGTLTDARAMVEPYAENQTLKQHTEDLLKVSYKEIKKGAYTTFSNALLANDGDEASTLASLQTMNENLSNAMFTYIANANPAKNVSFDLTWMIKNATPVDNVEGWVASDTPNHLNENHVNTEFWNQSGATLKQTVKLPAGLYQLRAQALTRLGSDSKLIAGDSYVGIQQVARKNANNLTEADKWFKDEEGNKLFRNNLFFEVSAAGDVEIGVEADASTVAALDGVNDHWTVWSSFELYKVAEVPEITIKEKEDYLGDDGEGRVVLSRDFTSKWSTIVLPFQVAYEELVDVFGTDVAVAIFEDVPVTEDIVDEVYNEEKDEMEEQVTKQNTVNSVLKITQLEKPCIPANMPVLIKVAEPGSEYVFENRTLVDAEPVTEGTNFSFVGVYLTGTKVSKGDYFLSDGILTESTGDAKLKTTHAYIQNLSGGKFTIEGLTTRINEIDGEAVAKALDGAVYNLAGQRVNKLQKGIYVVGGKKVLVK